jgi:hypothetical protein
MANLTSSQIKDSYQSVLTTSETTSDPTTGTLQNGKGTAITTLTVSGTVNATTLGGTLSTASQPNVTSVGTLSSATISGDLTVDTSTLKVDSANNRVGIGTASPDTKLEVTGAVGTGTSLLKLYNNSSAANDNIAQIDFELDNSFSGVNVDAQITVIKTNAGNHESALLLKTASGTGSATERMRIDASGNVGIGVTPLEKLVVSGGALQVTGALRSLDRASSSVMDFSAGKTRIFSIGADASTYGAITFEVSTTTTNQERLRIDSDGLKFNGDTAAANALDDYEEGTFDFGIAFGGSSTGVTYSSRAGAYTKIGRQVSVNGAIVLTSKGAQVGDVTITGLPFVNAGESSISIGAVINISFADFICGNLVSGGSSILIRQSTNAGVFSSLTNTNFADNSVIVFSFNYFV